MSYKGKRLPIPLNRGGISGNPNIDEIPIIQMLYPSRNLNLHEDWRKPRGGTSIVDSIATATTVQGGYHFTLNNGTDFVVRAVEIGGNVDLYKDDTTAIKTNLTALKQVSFEVMNNELYMCNGADTPEVWSGAGSTTTLVAPNVAWTGSNNPFQLVVHGKENSERMWAIGALPKFIYYSEDNDGSAEADFTGGTSGSIYIETGDGAGITGAVVFGDNLICFSNKKAFIIDDSSLTLSQWRYNEAIWAGGAANHRLIVRIPNDLVCMMQDGSIYSVSTAEYSGDYKQASLTRPSHMDKWIRDYVDLTKIAQFHAIYDPVLRAIKFFVVRKGQTLVDTALVYFIDRPIEEAWMIHGNWSNASGYDAACSFLYKDSTNGYEVYTGDSSGQLWKLETANKNDNNNAYYAGWKMTNIAPEEGDVDNNFKRLIITAQPQGAWDLQVKFWVDGVVVATDTISLAGVGGVLGSFTLGTSLLGGNEIISSAVDIGAIGSRIQMELYNSTADQSFAVSKTILHYKPLGVMPE